MDIDRYVVFTIDEFYEIYDTLNKEVVFVTIDKKDLKEKLLELGV